MTFKLVANLKMHMVEALITEYKVADVPLDLLVPYPYLTYAMATLVDTPIRVGAQNVSQYTQGAYTGQVSCEILESIGVKVVMIGHQEVGDSPSVVAKKLEQAQQHGQDAIVCVGESDLEAQLKAITSIDNVSIAYEPLAAIGSGQHASLTHIRDKVSHIKACIKEIFPGNHTHVPVLYGGSVNDKNCHSILDECGVDGLLVGGAALNIKVMLEVIKVCKQF